MVCILANSEWNAYKIDSPTGIWGTIVSPEKVEKFNGRYGSWVTCRNPIFDRWLECFQAAHMEGISPVGMKCPTVPTGTVFWYLAMAVYNEYAV